jgi:hypothetical protein
MNVFEVRNRLVADYSKYIGSFIQVRDEKIRHHVESSLASGLLWPDPLIQLNPAFEPGDSIDELVATGQLHDECANVFRKDKTYAASRPGRTRNGRT